MLSILVLFMLIGTAFLMSSNQYGRASKASAKLNRVGNHPTKLLDRAVMQVLRDTGNPNSSIRYHSLLRDLYGTDGFEAEVYVPEGPFITAPGGEVALTRYAGATPAMLGGPTQGQMIDIYFKTLRFRYDLNPVRSENDPQTTGANDSFAATNGNEQQLSVPDSRHVIRFESNPDGIPQQHALPLTRGYYNGCLLTITSGPAQGQSVRIVDYQFVEKLTTGLASTQLFRLRVLAFPRSDGSALVARDQLPASDPRRIAGRETELVDLVVAGPDPQLGTLRGHTFIVNGRPFNGTGTGYNPFAAAGTPRLTARESIKLGYAPTMDLAAAGLELSAVLYPEIALVPNAAYFIPFDPRSPLVDTNVNNDTYGARYLDTSASPPVFRPLNPKSVPLADRATLWRYPSFAGPGDVDESYDAADFQNMALALQTVTPRARGRVVTETGTYEVDDPNLMGNFLRLDLEDLPLPSFHRPDLLNFWYHRLVAYAANPDGSGSTEIADDHVHAVLQPYVANAVREPTAGDDPGVPVAVRDQIVALKRKISLRPLREDHPNFDGSNPESRPVDLSSVSPLVDEFGNITVPYPEVVGPWDVDNDNDGVPDSIWVDLGEPVTQAEDGTLYKPLFAFLVMDMDSRLNVNAHGLVDHMTRDPFKALTRPDPQPNLDVTINTQTDVGPGNLANDTTISTDLRTSNLMPHGIGYGPAEISLRPVLSPLLPSLAASGLVPADNVGNPVGNPTFLNADDYARLLVGRPRTDLSGTVPLPSIWGRHGSLDVWDATALTAMDMVKPGMTYNRFPPAAEIATSDPLASLQFFGYPSWLAYYYGDRMGAPQLLRPTAFGSPPDLMGRYAIGLDYTGQPVYEAAADAYVAPLRSILHDSPYELNLADPVRRDAPDPSVSPAILGLVASGGYVNFDDDAPFATADLERILRSYDADAGILPDRLWNVVDAFDPVKLVQNQPAAIAAAALQTFGVRSADDAQRLAVAQQTSAINRRLVTTDSYDLPVPGTTMPVAASPYGPDGMPGRRGFDDDGDGITDGEDTNNDGVIDFFDNDELGAPNTDDFRWIFGKDVAKGNLVDLLTYRVWREMRTQVMLEEGWDEDDLDGLNATDYATFIQTVSNRANAIISGEPFVDNNGNGRYDAGDTYTDVTDNGAYDYPLLPLVLAPEILAGQRMDLNRPFGDGRDNGDLVDNDGDGVVDEPGEPGDLLLNGVVDEPGEAGEPFLDVNGNGKWDAGEPFIDLDRDGFYDGPRDHLWPELTASGALSETIVFDYTNGQSVPIRPEAYPDTSNNPRWIPGGIRNLDSQARQLYARQLYTLMMLLVDENYLETPNVPSLGGNDVNQEFLLEAIAERRGRPGAPNDEDRELAMRKLTARRIAQWAINCVDFRDADAIMTPFEYDENPWDGWGTLDRNNVLIPLDGDVATNENGNELMPEVASSGPVLATDNWAQVIDWERVPNGPDGTAGNADDNSRVVRTDLVTGPTTVAGQTRGVVWGVERPELLITETLAFHDRRCTDERLPGSPMIGQEPATGEFPDYDLDQRLKPRGSLFVELYNPWSEDGQRPAELCDRVDIDPTTPGVQFSESGVILNKLSDVAARDPLTGAAKRSPVWRIAAVRDPINGRLTNRVIDIANLNASDFESYITQLLSTDPDGFGFSSDRDAERLVYFTTGDDPQRDNDNNIESTAGQPGEYNLSGPVPQPVVNQLRVWVPPLAPPRFDDISGEPSPVATPTNRRYFIARTERHDGPPYNDVDVPIAPILPGRYAVVGSSGMQLIGVGSGPAPTPDAAVTERYVTPISRLAFEQSDTEHKNEMPKARRIELWPSTNPDLHQILVAKNGGPEFVRVNGSAPFNVHDPEFDGNPTNTPSANRVIDPCVAIPVEDLSVSEPVEGYPSNLYRDLYATFDPTAATSVHLSDVDVNDDGELAFAEPYDHPLDLEFDLVRNGTTQNYRSIHLQRLANPMLPWNPPPLDDAGNVNQLHQPHLPVNPYLTVDSQSVDLTAYNGASEGENLQPGNGQYRAGSDNRLSSTGLSDRDLSQGDFFAPLAASEYRFAPDHVIWGLIRTMVEEQVRPWVSVDEYRTMMQNGDPEVELNFAELEARRESTTPPGDRGWLSADPRLDDHGRDWGGQRGWSLLRRVLPDNPESDQPEGATVYRQQLSLRSLERGGHDSLYLKYPNLTDPEGWWFDPRWVPRVLWKQEQPNTVLFLKSGASPQVTRVSGLETVLSRRQYAGGYASDETPPPPDIRNRNQQIDTAADITIDDHAFNYLVENSLGFANESYAPELDRATGNDGIAMMASVSSGAPEIAVDGSSAAPVYPPNDGAYPATQQEDVLTPRSPSLLASTSPAITPAVRQDLRDELTEHRRRIMRSTYPWMAWNNRPFTSAGELLQVPSWHSSLLLRNYSVINRFTANPYDGDRLMQVGGGGLVPAPAATQIASQLAPFGHLLNFFADAGEPAKVFQMPIQVTGAPHYHRILDYVQVPSRYVGTDSLLAPEVFNDNPFDSLDDMTGPADPRMSFQPPFNKVSRERDPGKVNLNTVVGRRIPPQIGGTRSSVAPRIWSEVYDGLMHRYQDDLLRDQLGNVLQLGHFGPAWRDVVLSRKGYAQFNAYNDPGMDFPLERLVLPNGAAVPEVYTFGLNRGFPTVFANPFRSSDAGDLVPLPQMQQYGVDASWLRVHPRFRGNRQDDDGNGVRDDEPDARAWGRYNVDDDGNGLVDDALEAGYGDDLISHRGPGDYRAVPEEEFRGGDDREKLPLFSESTTTAAIDATRNPYMMYQPMTRLGNLVTTRSNVYAIWVTVGYFEVEPAPNWNDPDTAVRTQVRARFGATTNDGDPQTVYGRAVYDRVYPEGYTLGQEVGSDTGNVRRQRAFYIIDRTEPVGFKPGEDLNVERMIRVRRRID